MGKFDIEKYNNPNDFNLECQKALKDIKKARRLYVVLGLFFAAIFIPIYLTMPNKRGHVIIEIPGFREKFQIISIFALIALLIVFIASIIYIERIKKNRFKSYIVRKVWDQKTDLKLYQCTAQGFRKRNDKLRKLFGLNDLKKSVYINSDYLRFDYRGYDIRYSNTSFRLAENGVFHGISLIFRLPRKLYGKRALIVSSNLKQYFIKVKGHSDAPIFTVEHFDKDFTLCRHRGDDADGRCTDTERELSKLDIWENKMKELNFFDKPLTPSIPAPTDTFTLRDVLTRELGQCLEQYAVDSKIITLFIDRNIMALTVRVFPPLFEAKSEYQNQSIEEVTKSVNAEASLLLGKYIDPMLDVLDSIFSQESGSSAEGAPFDSEKDDPFNY